MFCALGNYSVSNNPVDVYLCAGIVMLGTALVVAVMMAPALRGKKDA
jgi:TctA family transporter